MIIERDTNQVPYMSIFLKSWPPEFCRFIKVNVNQFEHIYNNFRMDQFVGIQIFDIRYTPLTL